MKHKDVGTHWNRIQKPYEEHSIKKENLSRIFADRIFSICGVLSSFSNSVSWSLLVWMDSSPLLFVFMGCICCFLFSGNVLSSSYHNSWKLDRNFDRTSVGRFYYQNKRHKNHAGYVYRKSMEAQGTLRSFDLATRFPTFVYYRNDCWKEKSLLKCVVNNRQPSICKSQVDGCFVCFGYFN